MQASNAIYLCPSKSYQLLTSSCTICPLSHSVLTKQDLHCILQMFQYLPNSGPLFFLKNSLDSFIPLPLSSLCSNVTFLVRTSLSSPFKITSLTPSPFTDFQFHFSSCYSPSVINIFICLLCLILLEHQLHDSMNGSVLLIGFFLELKGLPGTPRTLN